MPFPPILILIALGASAGYFGASKAFDGVKKLNHAVACHVRRDCPPKTTKTTKKL